MRRRNMQSRFLSLVLTTCMVAASVEGLSPAMAAQAADADTYAVEARQVEEAATESPETEPMETSGAYGEAAETQSEAPMETSEAGLMTASDADAAFDALTAEMEANIPEGQKKLTYGNNYQSNEEEPFTFKSGQGTVKVDNGLTVTATSLTENAFLATWDKTPYLSAGVMELNFKYQSSDERIGFIIKSNDDYSGLSIRYDVEGGWVIQDAIGNGDSWENVDTNFELKADTNYKLRIGFYGKHLIVAVDDAIIYNKETDQITDGTKDARGQVGLYKWHGTPATFSIKDFTVSGIGTVEKPSNLIKYTQDYENTDYVPNWSNNAAAVETTDDGNRVLKIAAGKARVADLDSPDIKEGTLSLRYKAVAPTGQTPKQFGFRFGVSDSKFRELNWDGGQWVIENQKSYPTIDMAKPVSGTWNDLTINFQEGTMAVYLNKELVGNFEKDVLKDGDAGKFGIRTWGNTYVLIDDVLYTNQIIEPEEVEKYQNDFEDKITGEWSKGTASIVKEGSNRILALNGLDGVSVLNDSVKLSQGTFAVKVKAADPAISLKTGSGELSFNGDKWEFVLAGKTYQLEGEASSPKVNAWNDIAVSFTGDTVTLSINGKRSEAALGAGAVIEPDCLGIGGKGSVYVDDINYTEQFVDLSTAPMDKMYYEEYFETIANVDWTGLDNAKVEKGFLNGSVNAKTTAANNDVVVPDNGVFQVKMQADQLKYGLQAGNLKVYNTSATEWTLEGPKGSKVLGSSEAVAANTDRIVRVEIIKGILTLKVNGQTAGAADVADVYEKTGGKVGVYNPNSAKMNVKIDAMGAEEILHYTEKFGADYTPNWTSNVAISDTNKVTHDAQAGTLTVKVPGVSRFLDQDVFPMKDLHAAFDFRINVDDGLNTGGRYGFVFRDTDFSGGLSIEVDINGVWRVNVNDSTKDFGKVYSLKKDETYRVAVDIVGTAVSLKFTDKDGSVTDMGSVTVDSMPETAGLFGTKTWFNGKEMTFSNLEMVEEPSLPLFNMDEKTDVIKKNGFEVQIDKAFPRIISYTLNGKTMQGQEEPIQTMMLNGTNLSPAVVSKKISDSKYEYTLSFAEQKVEMTAALTVEENNVVAFHITKITENGDFKVRTVSLGNNNWAYADNKMEGASYAWTKSSGQWHGVTEELQDDMSAMEKGGTDGATMAMISGNGLAASIENNVMSGGNKVILEKSKKPLLNKIQIRNGEWTYRHAQSDETEKLPWAKIVITEDTNSDKTVDWQDGAVAHRKYILTKAVGSEDMKNNMMYIAFNFASQANDPFLNSLDTGKVLYNYMDGFGQMVLHKGYQAEGHDDDIPSYSNIGVRQGGLEDFKYLIKEGDKYNMNIGVHLNATEYQLDANELYYSDLTGATAAGYQSDTLSKGWDWIDTAYYVNQTKDILSKQLEKRLTNLYNISKTGDIGLDFYYIDVYTGNDYNASKLVEYINNLGLKMGTEFSGPAEPGVAFTHWGTDLGYPNKGNKSILSRMVKNDLDIFVGNALYKGQKIPVVATWGDSKTDVQQGVTVFYNEVLPTKFMQHFGVLKSETDKVTFEENVTSERNKETGMVELRQNGKLISSWRDTGTTTDEGERHAGEANSLIPWSWDVKTNKKLGVNDGAKLYHWNTTGDATTWELTDEFKNVAAFDLYETTQQGKVKIATIQNNKGTITIDQAKKNTPYVLYPSSSTKLVEAAGNWGEGSPAKDFAFNSEKFKGESEDAVWKRSGDAAIEVVLGKENYDISKEMSENRWNRYAQFKTKGGTLSQTMTGLEPGQDYTVGVWTEAQNGRKSTIQVTIDGKTYRNSVTGKDGTHRSSFKYVGTSWQKMDVEFHVPEGVTTATLKLKAEAGNGTVSFDDVKVWKHVTAEKDVNNSDYVLFEDFENTYEGWGPFEYGGGSRKIHIATDQSNANDNNPVVKPGEDKVGPVMTWVLDGQNSLKLNENETGRYIVTNENSLKLLPNTTYDLSFDYTLEDGTNYVVFVKPVSQGDGAKLAFTDHDNAKQVQLALKHNTGDKATKATFTGKFTTGDANDYQVYIYETDILKPTNSNPTSAYALILDNVAVKVDAATMRTNVQSAVNGYGSLKKDDYFEDTWTAFEKAKAAAQAAINNANASGSELLKAYNDLDNAAAGLLNYEENLADAIADANAVYAKTYSALSYQKVQKALEAASKVDAADKRAAAQAAKDINDAIAALVNITKADKVIADAKKISQGGYTKESWESLQKAIQTVENLIANSADLTQQTLDAEVQKITSAAANLVKAASSDVMAKLKQLYDAYKAKDAVYTTSSYQTVKQILTSIEKLLAAPSNVTEKEANDMLTQANAAVGKLVKRADTSKLAAEYNKAKAINFSQYTDASANAVKGLFSAIDTMLKNTNATQTQVNDLYNKLVKAESGLVKVSRKVTSIKMSISKKTLGVGEKYKLRTTVRPKGASAGRLTWKSSNSKVAKVSSKGQITAKRKGTTTITVKTSNGKKARCRITVKPAPKKVTLTAKKKTLKVRKTLQLKTTLTKGSTGKVTYSSNRPKIATVSSKGKVKALKKGRVTITVRTYNGKKDTVRLTIKR